MSQWPRAEIVRVETGWFFRAVAANGRTLCHSEVYKRRGACVRGLGLAASVLHWSPRQDVDERGQS